MAADRRKQFDKQPYEEYNIDLDFNDVVPVGADQIVSGIASAIKWPRKQPTNTTPATSEILTSTIVVPVGRYYRKARFRVFGGLDGYEYKITIRVVWDNSEKLEEEVFVRVREE